MQMNRIKEVLEKKESNKSGLPKNSAKATIWLILMCKTDSNQDWKFCMK